MKQLFEDYKPIKLMIWRTFTDTVEQLFYLQVGTYAEELGIPRLNEAVNGKMEVPKIW